MPCFLPSLPPAAPPEPSPVAALPFPQGVRLSPLPARITLPRFSLESRGCVPVGHLAKSWTSPLINSIDFKSPRAPALSFLTQLSGCLTPNLPFHRLLCAEGRGMGVQFYFGGGRQVSTVSRPLAPAPYQESPQGRRVGQAPQASLEAAPGAFPRGTSTGTRHPVPAAEHLREASPPHGPQPPFPSAAPC